MFGVIYVFTNPFLSFLCIDSIKAFRFEPFVPIADNKAFKRLVFAISRFEVEGVVGFLPCKRPLVERRGELVGLYGCMVARLNEGSWGQALDPVGHGSSACLLPLHPGIRVGSSVKVV